LGVKGASQSLQAKMGHFDPNMPNVMRELSNNSNITFLNARIQRIDAFHLLPYNIVKRFWESREVLVCASCSVKTL